MTRALVTKMLRALDASRDDVNECLNEVLPKAGSYRYDRVIDSLTTKLTKHDAAITAARDYLATEPSGERAELIAGIKHELAEFAHNKTLETLLLDAVELLEADAQPKQVTCQIYGHVVGACVECNTHIEAQQAKPKTMGDVQEMCIAALQRDERAQLIIAYGFNFSSLHERIKNEQC